MQRDRFYRLLQRSLGAALALEASGERVVWNPAAVALTGFMGLGDSLGGRRDLQDLTRRAFRFLENGADARSPVSLTQPCPTATRALT